jgi:TolB-like protein
VKADLLRVRVGESAELTDEPINARGRPKGWRWISTLPLVIILAAAFVAVLWKTAKRPDHENAEALPRVASIAVLPLENLSHDPEQEYLADGITDELITNLSKVSSLRVIARSSAMRYKARPRSIPEIAKELKVDAVLEGTVLPAGNRIRMTTELIDPNTQRRVWAERYEVHLDDVRGLHDRIARAIISVISVKLTARDEQRFRAVPVNSEAYLSYLRGLFYYDKGFAKKDVEAAVGHFERATILDGKFALAYARLADAYTFLQLSFDSSNELAEKASVAARQSLSLDPNLAEAYWARGKVAAMLGFPPETEMQDIRQALALNPNFREAHFSAGTIYLQIGLLDEALSELSAVLALDPYSVPARYYVARIHLYQQRYEEAFLDYQQSPDFAPALLWQKVLILFYMGQKKAAHELIRELRQELPDNADVASTYAILLAAEGNKTKAEEQIALAIRTGEGRTKLHFHYAEYNIASAYALMGDRSRALQWLRRTAQDRITCYPLFERDPNLNNLRDDPDFKTWLAEMKSLWERRRASL